MINIITFSLTTKQQHINDLLVMHGQSDDHAQTSYFKIFKLTKCAFYIFCNI